MKYLSKIGIFVLLFALISQSFHTVVYAVSNVEGEEIDIHSKAIVILEGKEDDIPILEEKLDSSEVIHVLKHEDEVNVLKESDKFTYVEYIDENTDELFHGYVYNDYLVNKDEWKNPPTPESENQKSNTEEQINDEGSNEESNDNDSNVTVSEDQIEDTESGSSSEQDDESMIEETEEESEDVDSENNKEDTGDSNTKVTEENLDENGSEEENLKEKKNSEIKNSENDETKRKSDQSVQMFSMKKEAAKAANQKTLYGIALKEPTKIYAKQATNSKVIKSYGQGSKLKYKTHTTGWYEATVYVNGKYTTGYINVNDVENLEDSQTTLNGIGLKKPTKVYQKASTGSKVLKSYTQGTMLKYKTFTSGWYEATVWVNGKYVTGYINANDVETPEKSQKTLNGIGLKSPTKVYQNTSTGSKVLKSYTQGTMLKYKTFTSGWYEAAVRVNGKYVTGYINANDVESPEKSQKTLHGIGLKSPTKVYQNTSTGSKVLKSYTQGTMLKYKTFTSGWYEATVRVNGKYVTGYINANDVETPEKSQKTLHGIGLKSPTKVYQKTSTGSKVLKSYANGTILKYKSFTSEWYEATVYINGKPTAGYIHANHVEELFTTNKTEKGLASKNPTKVYSRASQSAPVLKTYSQNSVLKFETFSPNWYRATVYVNGNKETGYISHKDVNQNDVIVNKSKYKHNFNDVLDLQMTRSPQVWKNGTFVDASREQVSYYLNSSNFKPNTSGYLQFLDLSSPAGVNANEINTKVLHNAGTLTGMAKAFIEAGKTYNVNEIYLMSHALHETGNGKSTLAKGVPVDKNGNVVAKSKAAHTVYNMYGYGAYDSDPLNGGAKYAFNNGWFTPEAAIIGGAKDIANNYVNSGQNTLYKMRWNPISPGYPQYATDIAWALSQTANISKIYDSLSNYVLVYDVPVYNGQPTSSGDPNKYKEKNVSLEVTATSINVRSGAGTSYKVLGGVQKGNILNAVLDKNNNVVKKTVNGHVWYQIYFNNSTAWISGGKNGTEYIRVR